jgi:hypothetical protein
MYSGVAERYLPAESGTEQERPVWELIEQVEITLRRIVRERFDSQWGRGKADAMMRRALGDESWSRVLDNQAKGVGAYRYSRDDVQGDVLDFTYIGQLGTLITWGTSWALFKDLFRDKRELEDMLSDIAPVRNDRAHFRSVPHRELDRCRLRCDDLLAILPTR